MSTKTAAGNPPVAATGDVDADGLCRMLDTGKISIATVFARVAEGMFSQDVAAAAVAQHSTNAAAAAASAAAAKSDKDLTVKVSVKGGGKDGDCKGGSVGIYGINTKFPIGTYAEGWLRIIPFLPNVLLAIENDPNVTAKNRPLADVRAAAKAMRLKLETVFPRS